MRREIQELMKLGRYLKEQDMLLGSSGNISVRVQEGFLISASGTCLDGLKEDDVSICSYNGTFQGKNPSKEYKLHQTIYEQREDINCVIHCSPFYATLLACSQLSLKKNIFVETMYYLEGIYQIPFDYPGSSKLEHSVEQVCESCDVILMRHHGVMVYGCSIEETVTTLEVLERCCKMNVIAYDSLLELSKQEAQSFLEYFGNKYKWSR